MDLQIVIEGVSDEHLANEIKQRIRKVGKHAARAGEWTVVISPSETRGQWDLGVRGPFGHHFTSFTKRVDQLPDLVAEELRAYLCLQPDSGQDLRDRQRSVCVR